MKSNTFGGERREFNVDYNRINGDIKLLNIVERIANGVWKFVDKFRTNFVVTFWGNYRFSWEVSNLPGYEIFCLKLISLEKIPVRFHYL